MSQTLTLELSDEVYTTLHKQAAASGTSPADLVAGLVQRAYGNGDTRLEAERQAARERFERHFGAVNLGHAIGVDNDAIDAELAREYANAHESE